MIEIVYTWQDGREEVRYRRANQEQAEDLIAQVNALRARNGESSPYSYRVIEATAALPGDAQP